jgi:hypothetical protein
LNFRYSLFSLIYSSLLSAFYLLSGRAEKSISLILPIFTMVWSLSNDFSSLILSSVVDLPAKN